MSAESCERVDPLAPGWFVRGIGYGIVLGAASAAWVDFVVLAFVGVVIAQVVGPLLAMRAKSRQTAAR
jgi:hypothetical protein